jgi:hypothetical protein
MSPPRKDQDLGNLKTDRLRSIREIGKRIQNDVKHGPNLTYRQKMVAVLSIGAVFLFWSVWTGTWPIPRGKENREKAVEFLRHEFADHVIGPAAEKSSTAPLAAVFYIIQSGEEDDANKAIQFATEQSFGYASPYVIERLESDNTELRHAARQFLQKMSGKDYGSHTQPWKEWWNDPPRKLFGVMTVGHNTVQTGIPIASGFLGILLLIIGSMQRKEFFSVLGTGLFVMGWFLSFSMAGLRLVGSFDTFTFDGIEIVYHQDHGIVEGLKDAKVGGAGLWLLLCLTYVAVPFIVMAGVFVVLQWRMSLSNSNSPPATQ